MNATNQNLLALLPTDLPQNGSGPFTTPDDVVLLRAKPPAFDFGKGYPEDPFKASFGGGGGFSQFGRKDFVERAISLLD